MNIMKKTATMKQSFLQGRLPAKHLLVAFLMLFHVLMVSFDASAQNITVSGRVTKDDGQPVPNASVQVKGSSTGTSSNDNGEFRISAPGNGTLVVSSVDYVTIEVKINNRTTIEIKLTASDR